MSLSSALIWILLAAISRNVQTAVVCHPAVTDVRFDGALSREVSIRLAAIYRADQDVRQPDADIDPLQIFEEDQAHREEVMSYLQEGRVINGSDLFVAALIFQHGDCPDHFQLAADLALRAHDLGDVNATWLYTAATDRYLLSTGNLQRYGTQYVPNLNGRLVLCPVDGMITDAERAEWGVGPLSNLPPAWIDEIVLDPHPLAMIAGVPFVGAMANQVMVMWNCLS